MYLSYTPSLVQRFFNGFTWKVETTEKVLYLTFDDGPIPEVTPWVLDVLDEFHAKATFFCVGENVMRNPDIFNDIKARGHSIGSHTYNHLSGWTTPSAAFLKNIRKASQITQSKLFRPPYGRISPHQARILQNHFQIVMWDVLSGDFDLTIDKETCFQNVIKNASEGSIIVFHDSLKSKEKLNYALPKVLEYYSNLGYRFERI
jgi:peptidoglycan/xylan/chitin deacetylase (PgdA/CDA1 family)